MKRKTEYVLRSVTPPVVREFQRARALARHNGGGKHPLALLKLYHSSRLELLPVSFDLRAGLVVDIGANVGEWTAAVLEVAPGAQVLAIEPSPGIYEKFARRFEGQANVTLVKKAVGDAAGQATLYRTQASHNTSLLQPRADTGQTMGWGWDPVDQVTVDVVTLDDLVGDQAVSVLKIDVQGNELPLLKGAPGVLSRTAAVLIEVTTFSYYEGDSGFTALDQQLTGAGFRLSSLSKPILTPEQRITLFDACYLRDDVADRHDWLSRYGPGFGV